MDFRREAENTLEYFEAIINQSDAYTKNPTYYVAICWIASKKMVHPTILKKTISEKTNTSERLIYGETKKILSLIGLKTAQELKGKQLW